MIKIKCWTVIHCNATVVGRIGNVLVYRGRNGYILIDECDRSKFKFINNI